MSAKRAQSWCQSKNNIPYYEVSAKEAVNVEAAFQAIARDALARESQVCIFSCDRCSNTKCNYVKLNLQDTHDFPEFPDQIRLNENRQQTQGSGCNC